MLSSMDEPESLPEKRMVRRCVPPHPVTTSLFNPEASTFGTLSNICNFGACVSSDHSLLSGLDVGVLIGFDFLSRTFTTRGRVIWSRSASARTEGGSFQHGLRFTLDNAGRETLRQILGSREFQEGPPPPPGAGAFDDFMRELRPQLEALGRILGER
jgi:hypothetical protein